jgi:hypothetical protein
MHIYTKNTHMYTHIHIYKVSFDTYIHTQIYKVSLDTLWSRLGLIILRHGATGETYIFRGRGRWRYICAIGET